MLSPKGVRALLAALTDAKKVSAIVVHHLHAPELHQVATVVFANVRPRPVQMLLLLTAIRTAYVK